MNTQDNDPGVHKWVVLPHPKMTTWGRNYEICKNTLLWLHDKVDFIDSEVNIHEACRIMHRKSWIWSDETKRSVSDHPQALQISIETGCKLYNGLYTCLYAGYLRKISQSTRGTCEFCPIVDMKCSESGFMTQYRYNKKYALVIANAWKENV